MSVKDKEWWRGNKDKKTQCQEKTLYWKKREKKHYTLYCSILISIYWRLKEVTLHERWSSHLSRLEQEKRNAILIINYRLQRYINVNPLRECIPYTLTPSPSHDGSSSSSPHCAVEAAWRLTACRRRAPLPR